MCNLYFSNLSNNTDLHKQLFTTFSEKEELETTKTLLESFKTQKLCEEISVTAYDVTEGRKSLEHLTQLMEKLYKPITTTNLDFVSDNPEDLIEYVKATDGFRWRLKTLNRMLGSIRKGDFLFFVARPETGKTTMLASEVSYMLSQLTDDAGPIIWFNNEEQGSKVKIRVIQAYFGITHANWVKDYKKYTERFVKETKGRFKLVDNAVLTKNEAVRYIENLKPSLVVFDQLDKVQGFSNDREDLRLGAIYIWAREIAKKCCPVIGVSQASGSGEGEEFLTMDQISNSKTSKPAEADAIVGIGFENKPGLEYRRGISIIKNKLIGDSDTDPALRHGKMHVLIKPNVARYEDIH